MSDDQFILRTPEPDPRSDPPIHIESRRALAAGFACELVLVPLTYFFGGSFFPLLAGTVGIVFFAYALRPALFQRHIEKQVLQGTPYRRDFSPQKWAGAFILCLLISAVGSLVYRHYVPTKPNIVSATFQMLSDFKNEFEQWKNSSKSGGQAGQGPTGIPQKRREEKIEPHKPKSVTPAIQEAPRLGNLSDQIRAVAANVWRDVAPCWQPSVPGGDVSDPQLCTDSFRNHDLQLTINIRDKAKANGFEDLALNTNLEYVHSTLGDTFEKNSRNIHSKLLPSEIKTISERLVALADEIDTKTGSVK